MVMTTNHSSVKQEFHVAGGKKGEPKYEALAPGESRNLDLVDRYSGHNVGRERAGAVSFGDKAGRETSAAVQTSTPAVARKPKKASVPVRAAPVPAADQT